MRYLLSACLTVMGVVALAAPAQSAQIRTAIGLVIDGSGSISPSDFALQRDAYASVLSDPSVVPADGSVVVYVNQFSTNVERVWGPSGAVRIQSEADRTSLVNAIQGMTQLGGNTNIGDGILEAVFTLDAFLGFRLEFMPFLFADDFRALIDVSTDGQWNEGFDPADIALDAVNGDLFAVDTIFDQINCLGIGSAADCSWIPTGSFSIGAAGFADFESALRLKLGRELGTVPAPATIALFGLGLVGLGAMRRRRA